MEKIIIICNAQHLGYQFPKRKWYQICSERIALMRLEPLMGEPLEETFLLKVYEEDTGLMPEEMNTEYIGMSSSHVFCVYHPLYWRDICFAMFSEYRVFHENMEHVVIFDQGGGMETDLLYDLAHNRNYLTILTDQPEKYEEVLEKIEQEYGLVGMVFMEKKEVLRYLRVFSGEKKLFVAAGEDIGTLLYHIPKNSVFLDWGKKEIYRGRILKKRMKFTYVSIPIFLDNTAKNRYNAVVNEGITFQVINNKKTKWRRKGN